LGRVLLFAAEDAFSIVRRRLEGIAAAFSIACFFQVLIMV
jgi:hypothetical protein